MRSYYEKTPNEVSMIADSEGCTTLSTMCESGFLFTWLGHHGDLCSRHNLLGVGYVSVESSGTSTFH